MASLDSGTAQSRGAGRFLIRFMLPFLSGRGFSTAGFLMPILLLGILAAGEVQAGEGPKIVELAVALEDDGYQASLRLDGAFSQEILDTIASGLPVTFEYRVEVFQRRALWVDPVHLRLLVNLSVDFDSLTRQYHLTREVDGQVVDSAATEKAEEMQHWMTQIQVSLGHLSDVKDDAGHPWVRARCRLASRFVFFFFPQASETRWARIPLPPRIEEESP